jgi:hypothetical protein
VSNEIPTGCAPVVDVDEVAKQIRQAHKSEPPSHGERKREYFLKIISGAHDSVVVTACFVLVEYVGIERELYLWKVETEKNCSGQTFKYGAGSVRISNFLRQ